MMGLRCLFHGHDWTEWRHNWSKDAPRIVRASGRKCLNDPTCVRNCKRAAP